MRRLRNVRKGELGSVSYTHLLSGKYGVTESPKCAYYPKRREIHFVIRNLDECIEAAMSGEVK